MNPLNLYFGLLFVLVLAYQGCGSYKPAGESEGISALSSNQDGDHPISPVEPKPPRDIPDYFICKSGDPREPVATVLQRLNRVELRNTLEDIFQSKLPAGDVDNFTTLLDKALAAFPKAEVESGMTIGDHDVTVEHIDRQMVLAEGIADFISSSSSRMSAHAGTCYAQNKTAVSCKTNFLRTLGLKLLRRPLDDKDVEFYLATMAGNPSDYRNAIASLIMSPHFFYHTQFGESDNGSQLSAGSIVTLSAYERASRLSYLFLQSVPDDELFAAAENQSLMTTSGVSAQVERLIKLPLVQKRLSRQLSNQLMFVDTVPELNRRIVEVSKMIGEVIPAYEGLGVVQKNQAVAKLRGDIIEESVDFFEYSLFHSPSSFTDLLTSESVFPREVTVANIYGTSVWNGGFSPPNIVRAPAGQRAGLLTRALNLYTGTASTRPIMRGVGIFEDYMCGDLTLPDDNTNPEGVVLTNDMTDREYVKAITEHPGTTCLGCHQTIINPIGFTFDNFDSLGRWRSEEKVYGPEDSGNEGLVIATKPVHPDGAIILPDLPVTNVNNAVQMADILAGNSRAQACFATRIWSFAIRENLHYGEGACAVQETANAMSGTGTLLNSIKTLVTQPEFLKRKLR